MNPWLGVLIVVLAVFAMAVLVLLLNEGSSALDRRIDLVLRDKPRNRPPKERR